MPEPLQGIQWVSFGSTAFNASLPIYANVRRLPAYLTEITEEVSTEDFYWGTRVIGVLADAHYADAIMQIERYQNRVFWRGRGILQVYDENMMKSDQFEQCEEANDALALMAREETTACLKAVLQIASEHMKNGYNRSDN